MVEVRKLKVGKELDCKIAEKVMGWKIGVDPAEDGGVSWFVESNGGDWVETGYYPDNFKPSTDIKVAWEVVEKMNRPYIIASTEDGESWVHFGNEGNAAIGETPHAICIAALLTLEDRA